MNLESRIVGTITEEERRNYIAKLKGMRICGGESDPKDRRDLFPWNQSLLYLLRNIELDELKFVSENLRLLEKVQLLDYLGEAIGHRPQHVVFEVESGSHHDLSGVEKLLGQYDTIYIKSGDGLNGYRGEGIYRLSTNENGTITVQLPKGERRVLSNLNELELPMGIGKHTLYIAEAEISIARTEQDRTWEVRILPPHGDAFSYCKVGDKSSYVNQTDLE